MSPGAPNSTSLCCSSCVPSRMLPKGFRTSCAMVRTNRPKVAIRSDSTRASIVCWILTRCAMMEAIIVKSRRSSSAEKSSEALSIVNVPITFSSTIIGIHQKAITSLDSTRSGSKSLMELRGLRVCGTPIAFPDARTCFWMSSI